MTHIERNSEIVGEGGSCDVRVKVKVKLSLCLTKYHTVKTYCRSGGIAPRILNVSIT